MGGIFPRPDIISISQSGKYIVTGRLIPGDYVKCRRVPPIETPLYNAPAALFALVSVYRLCVFSGGGWGLGSRWCMYRDVVCFRVVGGV